jgi:hypothetical protein
MKLFILSFIAIVCISFPSPVVFAQTQEPEYKMVFSTDQTVSIDKDGKVSVNAAKVIQVSGTTIFAQSRFGNAPLRWILPTNANTVIHKRFDGIISVKEIAYGDLINFDGVLNLSGDSLNVTVSNLVDWTRKDEAGSFSGTVTTLATTSKGFLLKTPTGQKITVIIGDTTTITKGKLTISLAQIKIGDKINETSGTLDVPSKTLQANKIVVYQNPAVFYSQNFQGTLKSIDLTQNPPLLILTIGTKDYTVHVSSGAPILNSARAAVSPSRFMIGDTIRIYGAIRQTDLNTIDATLVRNTSL